MDYIQTQAANATSAFFQKVYGWMCGGLVISGLVAYFVANTPAIMNYIASNDMIFFIIMIAEFLLVI